MTMLLGGSAGKSMLHVLLAVFIERHNVLQEGEKVDLFCIIFICEPRVGVCRGEMINYVMSATEWHDELQDEEHPATFV